MSFKEVLLTNVIPALGAVISLAMYASPIKAVLQASKSKSLGDLNPLPFAVTVANTIVWTTYGLLKRDPYITSPNAPGIVLATFCTLTAFALADDRARDRIRMLLCFEFGALALLGVCSSFGADDMETRQSLWGLAGNVITLVYYGAPLSSMAEVIKTKNSASILLPLTTMNVLNASLWTTYGVATMDVYVWLPNGVGLFLSLAQVALALMFPAKAKSSDSRTHEAPYSRLHPDDEMQLPVSNKA